MTTWIAIFCVGIVTYALRLSFIILSNKILISSSVQRIFRFVPITVLPAIVTQELVLHNQTLNLSWQNPRLVAGILAIFVAWYWRNVFFTIGVGMIALVLAQVLLFG